MKQDLSPTQRSALASIKTLDELLREYVKEQLERMADIADRHGIVYEFVGLPPFEEYGNSGYYFPTNPENGEPWVDSGRKDEYYPLEHSEHLQGWLSSDAGC